MGYINNRGVRGGREKMDGMKGMEVVSETGMYMWKGACTMI